MCNNRLKWNRNNYRYTLRNFNKNYYLMFNQRIIIQIDLLKYKCKISINNLKVLNYLINQSNQNKQ